MIPKPVRPRSLQGVRRGLWISKPEPRFVSGKHSGCSGLVLSSRAGQSWKCSRFASTLANKLAENAPKTAIFQYFVLASGSEANEHQRIRILELLPGHDSSPIQCHLRPVSLLENPKYEALSYCWGDPLDRTEIICNSKSLSIPKTLAGALRGVRLADQPRILWADAICINQLDTSEKKDQVQLMREIYSQSQGTLIWLGDAGEIQGGISFWARMAVRLGLAGLRPRAGNSPKVQLRNTREMTHYEVSPFSYHFYLMLISMLKQPWFQRAWVVQEVVTATKATVVWGSVQCAWEDLIRALTFMSKVNFPLAFLPTLQHIGAIENERVRYKDGANTLLGLLLRQQRCMATNPKDKVYAFYGLIDPAISSKIGVDINYRESVPFNKVYIETATRILRYELTLDILSLPPSTTTTSTTTTTKTQTPKSDLPSWVPDWSLNATTELSQISSHSTASLARKTSETTSSSTPGPRARQFSAARSTPFIPSFSPCGNKLLLSGYVLDTITSAGPVFMGVHLPHAVTTLRSIISSYTDTLRSFLSARHVFLAWETLAGARSSEPYAPTGEKMLPVYFHTVSAGTFPDSTAVQLELYLWDKINCFTPSYLSFLSAWKGPLMDFFTLLYSAKLFLWYALSNKPLLKFELQARYTLGRRMVRTERGYVGLAGTETREGDCVVLCQGSRVPLVLRRVEEGDTGKGEWRLVGDAYVHGIMGGEGWEEERCGEMVVI